MVFSRNLCDYGQKHRNPLDFPQKIQRNRAEARHQIVEKNAAARGSLTVSKSRLK